MINPWQELFNTWVDTYLKPKEEEMKPYEVILETTARVSVFVDASSEDEAIEMAYDYLDSKEATFDQDWDVVSVSVEYDD